VIRRRGPEIDVARVPDSRKIFNNTCRDILTIAAAMLRGEMLEQGRVEEAAQVYRADLGTASISDWSGRVPTRMP
jgi:hypothetical protein